MTFGASGLRGAVMAVLLATGVGAVAMPRPAQAAESTEARLKRIEDQLRAVQRKVFPDGAGRILAPEIAPPGGGPAALPAPSSSTVTDLLSRLDTVEAQIRRLTAQSEENQNRLGKLEAKLAAMETAPAPTPAPAATVPAMQAPLVEDTRPVRDKPAAGTRKPASAKPSGPSADRLAAVSAIVKPQTGDAGEDDYLYGYELWNAKFYPEAQQALQSFVDTYPRHKRMSYARNLLGRVFLDDGKPGTAAQWFVQNYQADKKGERAPDSLLYLAVAMNRLKETKRACVALTELKTNFPDAVAGRLKGDFARAKTAGGCN